MFRASKPNRTWTATATLLAVLSVTAACSSTGSSGNVTETTSHVSQPSTATAGSAIGQTIASPDPTNASGTTAGAESMDQLIAAAKKEGGLTLYTAATKSAAQAQIDAFTKKYGVSVNMVRLTGAQTTQRVQAEAKAGQIQADVVVNSDPNITGVGMKDGWFIKLADAGIPGYPWNFPSRFLRTDIGSAEILLQMTGIGYNTSLVKAGDIPKKWTDLLDPKWKGKIGIIDLNASLGYTAEWQIINKMVGNDFLTKLGGQNLKVYAAGATGSAALGAGEISILADQLITNLVSAKDAGAPIAWTVPTKTTSLNDYVAIVAKAKHPAAARLFVAYIMSADGAKVLADAANSTSPYDTAGIPNEYSPLDMSSAAAQQAETARLLRVGN